MSRADFARAQRGRARRQLRADRLRRRRDPHHDRHRALAALRVAALLPARSRPSSSCSGCSGARRPRCAPTRSAAPGAFGAVPLFAGTLLITADRDAGRGADRAALGDLPGRVRRTRGCAPCVKPLLEILAGIPTVVYGFFAALTVAPLVRDARRRARARRRLRERAGRRPGDGHHDHPLRLLAVRRRHQRRAAVAARRLARPRRHALGDDPAA